jgi:antitoxin CcdA
MQHIYDSQAQKKATNLSINSDLLHQAKQLKINISATLEKSLSQEVRKCKEAAWLAENKEALLASNKFVEKHGVFAAQYRVF